MPAISVSKTGPWWGAKKWNLTIQTWKKLQGQFSNMACLISALLESTWSCSNLQELFFGRKCSLLVETRHFHKLTARWIKTASILINRQIDNSRVSLQHQRKTQILLTQRETAPCATLGQRLQCEPLGSLQVPETLPIPARLQSSRKTLTQLTYHLSVLVACNSLPDTVFCSMSPGYMFMFSIT